MTNVSSNQKTLRKRRPPVGREDRGKEQSQVGLVSANLRGSAIPPGFLDEIEKQRSVLVAIITLLYCLHAVLEHQEENVDEELNPRIAATVRWASLPEMTAMLLERTRAVLSALDSINLSRALKASKS